MFPYQQLEVYKKAYLANQKVYRFLKGNKLVPTYAKKQNYFCYKEIFRIPGAKFGAALCNV